MRGIWLSLRAFFAWPLGPLIGFVGVFSTCLAVAKFADDSGNPWMWLFLGAVAIVVLLFWRLHQLRMNAETVGTGSAPGPANRIDALVEQGEQMLDRLRRDDAWSASAAGFSYQQWTTAVTAALVEGPAQDVLVFEIWQDGDMPAGAGPIMGERARRAQLAWMTSGKVRALQDIALRVRVRAGEDVGRETARRATFKDLLAQASSRRQALEPDDPTTQGPDRTALRSWYSKVEKLVRAGLSADDAAQFLRLPADFDPAHMSVPGLDAEEIGQWVLSSYKIVEWQVSEVEVRDDFDPLDWRGYWD